MIETFVEWTGVETGMTGIEIEMRGETTETIETAIAMKERRGGIQEKGRAILQGTEILTGTPLLDSQPTRPPKDPFKWTSSKCAIIKLVERC